MCALSRSSFDTGSAGSLLSNHGMAHRARSVCLLLVAALVACGARSSLPTGDTDPGEGGSGGSGGAPEPPPPPDPCELAPIPRLVGRVWDQTPASLDFEGPFIGSDPGIVEASLGADGTPVYAGERDNPSTHGDAEFFVWFHDVPGKNLSAELELELEPIAPSILAFASSEFFPIDDALLGNEGRAHNFHFTVHLEATFRYVGSESFTFNGDDDLFVFINGRLVLDLGGVHGAESRSVEVDDIATAADLEPGGDFALDLFFAERHTSGSVFQLALYGFQACEA